MKKTLKLLGLGALLAASVLGTANAQSFTDVTKWNGNFGHRAATATSVSTIVSDTVMSTSANHTVITSASTTISGSLAYYLKNGALVSYTTITINVTPTTYKVAAPLDFQSVKVTPLAPGNASLYTNITQTKQ